MTGQEIRRIVLEQSYRAGVGHIGSALSVADILAAAYNVMSIEDPDDPMRDRFILSKGHAALALYGALSLKGFLSAADLQTYCGDDSLLGVHPEQSLRGIEFSTGSLGMGLSYGAGAALAAILKRTGARIVVLMSDAELNEGSVWEAIMFAAHHDLGNLTLVIDWNEQQAYGYTKDICDLRPIGSKLKGFGWNVDTCDGHDQVDLESSLRVARHFEDQPTAIIAETTFGKGVPYMEKRIAWHYLPMNAEQYATALEAVG
jgi:transketolase